MEEQLVSFETAKLAKEKGFDWKVRHHYRDGNMYDKTLICSGNPYNMNSEEEQKMWITNLYSTPTQSLLQKWLREEHNLHICIAYGDLSNKYMGDIMSRDGKMLVDIECIHKTYEEALEEGLQEALKLI